jgi:protein tyrosine/serine phosphatase
MKTQLAMLMIVLSFAGCSSRAVRENTPNVPDSVKPSNEDGVTNFGIVAAGKLYRGAPPIVNIQTNGYETLLSPKFRIRTIVDLTNGPEDHWLTFKPGDCARMTRAEKQALRYVRLPSFEWSPSREKLMEFLRIVQNPQNQPVFLHCAAGENRTGAMVAGYRILVENWNASDAKAEMTHFGLRKIWERRNDEFIDDLVRDRKKLQRDLVQTPPGPIAGQCP